VKVKHTPNRLGDIQTVLAIPAERKTKLTPSFEVAFHVLI